MKILFHGKDDGGVLLGSLFFMAAVLLIVFSFVPRLNNRSQLAEKHLALVVKDIEEHNLHIKDTYDIR